MCIDHPQSSVAELESKPKLLHSRMSFTIFTSFQPITLFLQRELDVGFMASQDNEVHYTIFSHESGCFNFFAPFLIKIYHIYLPKLLFQMYVQVRRPECYDVKALA